MAQIYVPASPEPEGKEPDGEPSPMPPPSPMDHEKVEIYTMMIVEIQEKLDKVEEWKTELDGSEIGIKLDGLGVELSMMLDELRHQIDKILKTHPKYHASPKRSSKRMAGRRRHNSASWVCQPGGLRAHPYQP